MLQKIYLQEILIHRGKKLPNDIIIKRILSIFELISQTCPVGGLPT